jgi:hypothetical protein
VPGVPGWEGIEQLWRYLHLHFGAACVSRVDGPDARLWTVKVRGMTLQLEHEDPYGNMIISCEPGSEPILREIAADLDRRLRGMPGS